MIERKIIEDLIQLMVDNDLVEIDVVDGDQSITLRRGEAPSTHAIPMAPLNAVAQGAAAAQPIVSVADASTGAEVAPATDEVTIDSPMVGTYYSRPNPDTDPYVSSGSKVSESTVICLVEAMKVFNEIKAECKGTITEVLVADGEPVEYGQPLFRVKPG